jgi:hypothetical protein
MTTSEATPGEPTSGGTEGDDADARTTDADGADARDGSRLLRFAGGVVGLFVTVGVGVGLAQNFTLSLLIEQLVDPGTNPTDNTLVGIVLVVDVVTPFVLGPVVAVGTGALFGRAMPDADRAAAVLSGAAAGVGFVLMTFLSLFLTFVILGQYGGGGGNGGPIDQGALFATVLETAIPVAVVGGLAALISARIH